METRFEKARLYLARGKERAKRPSATQICTSQKMTRSLNQIVAEDDEESIQVRGLQGGKDLEYWPGLDVLSCQHMVIMMAASPA